MYQVQPQGITTVLCVVSFLGLQIIRLYINQSEFDCICKQNSQNLNFKKWEN